MGVIRRVYLYLLTLAGLAMLAVGTASLGRVLVQVLDGSAAESSAAFVRDEVSRWGAAALVGLPVWLGHRWVAQRLAAASPDERASGLRRLSLYLTLALAALACGAASQGALSAALRALNLGAPRELRDAFEALPYALVGALVWIYHWRSAAADRAAVGEEGGSATLRRWYVYAVALVGFLGMLAGARELLDGLWSWLARSPRGSGPALQADAAAGALVGLGLWLIHWRWAPRAAGPAYVQQDQRSTLRSVYLFLTLALAVGATLLGASQIFYVGLARLLGVEQPGGVGGSLAQAAAAPGSAVLVYGLGWLYQRAAIRAEASGAENGRRLGVRRLYTYLVALLALGTLATGAAGLLWTLADAALHVPTPTAHDWWRNQLALFTTLVAAGFPAWASHWLPQVSGPVDERRSLSRRLYLYLALIAGALALLASTAAFTYRLLALALGEAPTTALTLDLSHALGVALVAGVLAAYHWRLLGLDARRGVLEPAEAQGGVQSRGPSNVLVRLTALDADRLAEALSALRARGVQVDLLEAAPAGGAAADAGAASTAPPPDLESRPPADGAAGQDPV